jgi:hypothetical protein
MRALFHMHLMWMELRIQPQPITKQSVLLTLKAACSRRSGWALSSHRNVRTGQWIRPWTNGAHSPVSIGVGGVPMRCRQKRQYAPQPEERCYVVISSSNSRSLFHGTLTGRVRSVTDAAVQPGPHPPRPTMQASPPAPRSPASGRVMPSRRAQADRERSPPCRSSARCRLRPTGRVRLRWTRMCWRGNGGRLRGCLADGLSCPLASRRRLRGCSLRQVGDAASERVADRG